MSEHTAGPWVAVEQPNGPTQITQGELDGPMICEFPYGIDTDMDRANAALIMAAPEMLAALWLFVSPSMGRTDCRGETGIGWQKGEGMLASERVEAARAAIAKATTP